EVHKIFDRRVGAADEEVTREEESARSVTGGDGKFRISGLPVGPAELVLGPEAPAAAPTPIVLEGALTDAGDWVLEEAASIAGTVLDPDGRPAPDATVEILPRR